MKHIVGECRLCGIVRPLSFEHVPPRAAYNAYPRFRPDSRQFLAHRYEAGPVPSMIEEPRGAGAYTLCGDCNNRCSRYANEFVDWAVGWQLALDSDPDAKSIRASQRCRRSRIMKQIVAMMLSASPPRMGQLDNGLRSYVWNAKEGWLSSEIRIYTALTRDQDARQAGGQGMMTPDGQYSVVSEIAFAPLILVMTLAGKSPDPRLLDVTFFGRAGYFEQLTTELELDVLSLAGFLPATYR